MKARLVQYDEVVPETDQIDRMLRYILMGASKGELSIEWTVEASDAWDRLSLQVEEIHANGMQVDLTMD